MQTSSPPKARCPHPPTNFSSWPPTPLRSGSSPLFFLTLFLGFSRNHRLLSKAASAPMWGQVVALILCRRCASRTRPLFL